MATAAEVALLRRLIRDPIPPAPALPRFTDAELATALDEAPSCPVPKDVDGFPLPGVVAERDTYGVAADLWDERAVLDEAEGTAPAPAARVTSERNGDVSVSYAGAGKDTGPAVLTAERMRVLARQLRKRSCNYAPVQTVRVLSNHGDPRRLIRGELYEGQVIN